MRLPPTLGRLAVLLALLPLPGRADVGAPPPPLPAFQVAELTGIARLRSPLRNSGGCTAVLIAADYALTARHCARGSGGNVIFDPDGPSPHHVAVAEVSLHPDYPQGAELSMETAGFDLSLLHLAEPVPPEIAQPIPLASLDAALPHALIGYLNANDGPLHGHDGCGIAQLSEALIASDCTTASGQSGGAFLRDTPQGWVLTGIVVATIPGAQGNLRSLMAVLDPATFPALAEVLAAPAD
ncbi:trypsin-like serine protease [Gymnodinialimonas sp. 2305UL16-5]|uniref:trypsin-like serine peptidase n=1 Tax=Gymnodinialimonas mytili TaxID=3126503 RepID=UPI0030B62281